ncbi:trimethylamine methyltransferase family protein [Chloroflexota bacterium]
MTRQGILVEPYRRLNEEQIARIHKASMEILTEPGIMCFNKDATEIFADGGAEVTAVKEDRIPYWILRIPERLISQSLDKAPKVVTLGARNGDNRLVLDGNEPRVRFASGSETNNWLEIDIEAFVSKNDGRRQINLPVFRMEKGNTDRLARAAHLCEQLESWDSFLRPVNIQDEDINDENKDVNKFFISLNNTTKHVMAGLTQLSQLDNVLRLAQLVAGGENKFRENPIISFITSLIKSPLQLVDDTTQKTIEIAKRGVPVVISSAPQGGSTAPILEAGIVAQINAEILTGIALTQLVNESTPVLYGSVPGRANMADLNDSYGVPEFSQYNIDCVQMARHYGLPCYSSGGVSDAKVPGIQASVERLFSQILVTLAGPQYLHYSFGLMERTSTFCPTQAVLDDAHLNTVKILARQPSFTDDTIQEILGQVRRVMNSSTKLFTRFARSALRSGEIAPSYPFEGKDMTDEALIQALERTNDILSLPPKQIEKHTVEQVFQQVPGLLTRLKNG